MNPELDRLARLFAAAAWDVLPTWARIILRVGWPIIVEHVIPAVIRLFALEQHAGIRGGNMAAIKVYDDIEDIARDAPADLVRALERAKSR